jgi:AcrR family transcriptional regulator
VDQPLSLRSDARRNREKILHTAREVFAEQGANGSLDEIARRAGIGPATLYRHFPSREDLLRAVFLDRMTENIALLETAHQCEDPWVGFTSWLYELGQGVATDRGYADMVATGELTGELGILRIRYYDAMTLLVQRTVEAGAIRPDYTVEDLVLLLLAIGGIAHRARVNRPAAMERFLTLTLDGLRPEKAGSAPAPAPTRVFPLFGANDPGRRPPE